MENVYGYIIEENANAAIVGIVLITDRITQEKEVKSNVCNWSK